MPGIATKSESVCFRVGVMLLVVKLADHLPIQRGQYIKLTQYATVWLLLTAPKEV